MKFTVIQMKPLEYLKAHGIEQRHGDVLYKRLPNRNFIVSWQSCNDIDIFLCKWLPASHEEITDKCIIDKIYSFDNTKEEKVAKFKLMLKY